MKNCIACILVIGTFHVFGQVSEAGMGIGGLTYTGDLQRSYRFLNNRPAANIYFRSNLNNEISLKTGVVFGILKDNDDDAFDALSINRQASFDITVFEASLQMEYHFLDFKDNIYLRWSPYVFGGFGLFSFSGEEPSTEEFSNIQFTIPFGLGIKYIVNPIWILGLEVGPRITFFDHLDNVSDSNIALKNFQQGNKHDNDKYYFIAISLSYSFYKIPCPFPNY